MFIFYQPEIRQGTSTLDKEESRHCVKVLRKKEGDFIRIADGQGTFYEAVIEEADSKKCRFKVIQHQSIKPDPFHIHIALAPTKNLDRTEWFVEKAVEIGVHQISLIFCENAERKVLKTERLERKAVSAMKQSQRPYMPTLGGLEKFEDFIQQQRADHKLIAYLGEQMRPQLVNAVPPANSYLVLIGPEGDFSEREVEQAVGSGFHPVSLGNSRLRTETAGIAACHTLQLIQLLRHN